MAVSGPGERSLRVAHVVLSLDCGGLERMVLGLVRAGRALGQDVSVVCVERPGTLAPQAEAAGARVACVDKRPGLRPGTIRRLRKVFRVLQPDVVHTHQMGALLYAGPAARSVGVPVTVHTEHGNHLKRLSPGLRRLKALLLWRYASRRAVRLFCVSADISQTVVAGGIAARKVVVVPNGIDTEADVDPGEVATLRRTLGLPSGSPVVGTVGRLTEIKRQDVLLRAFARVRGRRPEVRLLLVGDGDQRAALEALAGSLGVADAVTFAGYQARPEPFLRLMDVFALTSRSEGMPMALLEAWAARVPVVASRVGGIPELVDGERTGLLFDFPDDGALADLLATLLEDKTRALAVGDAGRRQVEAHFGQRAMARTYSAHYEELLATARREPATAVRGGGRQPFVA